MRNLLLQLRVEPRRDHYHLLMTRVESLVATNPAAAKFYRSYGPDGWLATPKEWQRSFLPGCPITSIAVERVNREVKRVISLCRPTAMIYYLKFVQTRTGRRTRHSPPASTG